MVHHINNKADLDQQLADAGEKLVVIDFFASWCGPCKMIAPTLETMSIEMSDVVFLKVNVDECEDIAAEYSVSSMPTFVFLKNNEKVHTFSGANESKLRETIAMYR